VLVISSFRHRTGIIVGIIVASLICQSLYNRVRERKEKAKRVRLCSRESARALLFANAKYLGSGHGGGYGGCRREFMKSEEKTTPTGGDGRFVTILRSAGLSTDRARRVIYASRVCVRARERVWPAKSRGTFAVWTCSLERESGRVGPSIENSLSKFFASRRYVVTLRL